ncbi:MAG: hypothetical protein LUC93_17420 [Planctomycetaceae bacterium]|nr:hypothetical protein [Planctomycetaceae bacterium]
MFDKVSGHCRIRESMVDILFVKLKKAKAKAGAKTPIRCQSSNECPRSVFCKFVNPLANHIPVDFADGTGTAEAS